MPVFYKANKNMFFVMLAALVIIVSGVAGLLALMAGAVTLACFFGAILLQAWGYLSYIAFARLVPFLRAVRSLW